MLFFKSKSSLLSVPPRSEPSPLSVRTMDARILYPSLASVIVSSQEVFVFFKFNERLPKNRTFKQRFHEIKALKIIDLEKI